MAKINLTLDTRRPLANGKFPIKLQIYINRNSRVHISMGVSVNKDQWMGEEIVRHPRKDALNGILRFRFNKAENDLFKLEATGQLKNITKQGLMQKISENFNTSEIEENNNTLHFAFQTFISLSRSERTKSIYGQTYTKIVQMYGELTLTDITLHWLRCWENDMLTAGLSINTISVHMRNLRAVFNRAIDDDIIPQNVYPFRKFRIKSERTAKRSLAVDELRTLRDFPCIEHQTQYRDMFMLIFYLMGINMVDLVSIKAIKTGRIEYRRSKTGRLYSVKVEPEALEIITKYRGKGYLLDINDRYLDYTQYLARMNRNLKQIGESEMVLNNAADPRHASRNKRQYKPLFPELSTYWARHTWATIAASLEIPKETIAAALGHGGNSVTDIYIDFDQSKVDAANRKVIDWLNSKR